MKTYRVAVIGTGYIGRVHVEQLKRVPGVEVAGVADKNMEAASRVGGEFGVRRVYRDAAEILADPGIDVIHNCTPNHLHFEINKSALEAGKQVFSEKPLALSAAESGELVRLAGARGATTGINFCYRYYPVVQEAAARVARGDIGAVYTVLGSYLQDWLLHETDYSWRLDPAQSGASNIMGDLGSHWCDLAQFVSGLDITAVMADLRTILPVRKRPKHGETLTFAAASGLEYEDVPVPLDDYGSILIRFENGARGAFTTTQLAAGRKCSLDIQVYGAAGAVSWNHERPAELLLGHRDGPNEILIESPILQAEGTRRFARLPSGHPMGYADAVLNLFSEFYAALRLKEEGRRPEFRYPDFEAGHREMLILEAVLRSARSGSWTDV